MCVCLWPSPILIFSAYFFFFSYNISVLVIYSICLFWLSKNENAGAKKKRKTNRKIRDKYAFHKKCFFFFSNWSKSSNKCCYFVWSIPPVVVLNSTNKIKSKTNKLEIRLFFISFSEKNGNEIWNCLFKKIKEYTYEYYVRVHV